MMDFKRLLRRNMDLLLPFAALLIAVLIMVFGSPVVMQASYPLPMTQTFVGEYSYDRENWYPLESEEELSARNQDLYLRGKFSNPIMAENRLYFFSNHIGGELYVNGERYLMDILLELEQYGIALQPSMCGKSWNNWYFEDGLPEDALIEIHLKNPHKYGNESAYKEFLTTMYCTTYGSEYLEKEMSNHSRPYLAVGIVLVITGILLMGSGMAGVILRLPVGSAVSKIGLLSGFSGGFFLLDTIDLSFWSQWNIFNTYGRQICMMYAVYLLGILAKDLMKGRRKKIAAAALMLSALVNSIIVLVSFAEVVVMYDTVLYWVISQMVLCPVLIGCCIGELFEKDSSHVEKFAFFLALFCCLILDIFGVADNPYSTGILTKAAFVVFFAYIFFQSAIRIITDHKASARAQKLEKELEESRIAIMLSQIQPHFIFNVLGTLRGLCREDPEQVWKGLGDFSVYLRSNMNALTNEKFIPFETELRHVETYLRLEQMRLGENLNVVYDIQERDFSIPPLTLQPLVENAVKHGIFYKAEGGTIVIHSRREGNKIILSVQDDGVGFDAGNPEAVFDRQGHIGLTNVRNRVEKMLAGVLKIESHPNQGSTVTVELPAENHL